MLELVPMTESDFAAWLDNAQKNYAAEKVAAGTWLPDEAKARSEADHAQLLPQGLGTLNHHFFLLKDGDQAVGSLWYNIATDGLKTNVFLYDLLIYEPFRRKGYGLQAMQGLEAHIRPQGYKSIALHVFGHNQAAQELYKKAGYGVADLIMEKWL